MSDKPLIFQAIRQSITQMIQGIRPLDVLEEEHLRFAIQWLASGAGIFRTAKPATPDPHLVAYFVVFDPLANKLLLTAHKRSGLWLPTGGHVEPGELPNETVKREAREELGIDAQFLMDAPLFLTVTQVTNHPQDSHTDITLWYLLNAKADTHFQFDQLEFSQVQWFSPHGIPLKNSDPHMQRFIAKLAQQFPQLLKV